MNMAAIVLFCVIGLIGIISGWLIWAKKTLWLLAGYDPSKVEDKEGLAKFAGLRICLIGICFAFFPAAHQLGNVFMWILLLLFLAIVLNTVLGCRKFEK
ncbi:MAG: DUF3784 domain-containing protein [Gemmatimonadota bacterium]|nr:MAG: DUF3784 domain-containing protein [Gemmatimonadota bacterium]